MTADEKNAIIKLRKAGRSLTEIADETGVSRNTVKSFCRRQGLTGDTEAPITDAAQERFCRFCGKPMAVYPGRKE